MLASLRSLLPEIIFSMIYALVIGVVMIEKIAMTNFSIKMYPFSRCLYNSEDVIGKILFIGDLGCSVACSSNTQCIWTSQMYINYNETICVLYRNKCLTIVKDELSHIYKKDDIYEYYIMSNNALSTTIISLNLGFFIGMLVYMIVSAIINKIKQNKL